MYSRFGFILFLVGLVTGQSAKGLEMTIAYIVAVIGAFCYLIFPPDFNGFESEAK